MPSIFKKLTPNLLVANVERSLAFYEGVLGFEPGPGLDRFALLGAVQAGAGQGLGGQIAGRKLSDGGGGGELVWGAHARSPRRRSTQSPVASNAASAWRLPTSWMPTGRPSGPVPAGKVRHGM